MSENMRLVDNWEDVTPPEEEESEEEGDEQSAIQSFEDALAERTDENRPPTAVDDEFGIRPGRTTIISVLDNDSDPDGDVLVVSNWDPVAEGTGLLDPIEGGRALQFTPAEGATGGISFQYTVDDGRGGTASATVTARIVPEGSNQQPDRDAHLRGRGRGEPDRALQRARQLARPRRRRPVLDRRVTRSPATWCGSPPTASSRSPTRPPSSARRRCSSRSPTATATR